jgi:hypothetical protein
MMLEAAGGEPTKLERPAVSDRSGSQNMPAEVLNSERQDALPTAMHSDAVSNDKLVKNRPAHAHAPRHPFHTLDPLRTGAGTELELKLTQSSSRTFNAGEVAATISNISEAAIGEAFAQLTEFSTANVRQAENESPWRKSLVAVPILLILAVERIAASSSRRASNGSATPAWRPLRSQQEPVDHRRH